MDEQNTNTVPEPKPTKEVKTEPTPIHGGVPLKTVLLIILLALVAGILVYVAISSKQLNNYLPTNLKEAKNPAETVLSMTAGVKDSATSTYFSDVLVDTGSNTINGVQLELYYDPSIITNVTIKSGSFFGSTVELLKKIDQTNGRISYALSVLPGQNGKSGKGTFATITYTVVPSLITDRTSFNFLPKTEVSGENSSGSLLKSTKDGDVIMESTETPTAPPTQ